MTQVQINPNKNPLPMEQIMKLKIFGIVSLKKSKKQYLEDNDLLLTLAAAYEYASAHYAACAGLIYKGLNPDDYIVAHIGMGRDIDQIVIGGLSQTIPQTLDTKTPMEKSAQELVNYVRYIFDKVGTEEEKKIAQDIIKKFQKQQI